MTNFSTKIDAFREILVLPLRISKADRNPEWPKFLTEKLGSGNFVWEKTTARTPTQSRAFVASGLEKPEPEKFDSTIQEKIQSAQKEAVDEYNKRWAFGEMAYFHPFVQDFLYDAKPDAPCHWYTLEKQLDRIRVEAQMGVKIRNCDSYVIDLLVDRCELAFLPDPGLAILVLEIVATSNTKLIRYNSDSTVKVIEDTLTLGDALSLHDIVRRIYPPFFKTLKPQHDRRTYDLSLFPLSVDCNPDKKLKPRRKPQDLSYLAEELVPGKKLPYAPWWHELLAPLVINNRFTQVVDERMPSMIFLGMKSTKQLSKQDLIRLCFADHPGNGAPYDPDFMKNFMAEHGYRRFSHLGTTYFASSYSFVCVTETQGSWNSPKFVFGRDVIQEHFRRHYAKMFFIVQMQKAALLSFSSSLSDVLSAKSSNSNSYYESIRKMRVNFLAFTHRYWFSNVSNQEQARELFALMQKHAGNHVLYEEVNKESAAAREEMLIEAQHNEMEAAQSQADSAKLTNIIIMILTAMTVPMVYFTDHMNRSFFWVMALSTGLVGLFTLIYAGRQDRPTTESWLIRSLFGVSLFFFVACLFFAWHAIYGSFPFFPPPK